ncbi:MAG: NAD-dependent epimerase/dehydratase family protein [Rhodospirillaceae bacterium]|nr:NAD-dependent epimerase/dehydratase family protein [Rhodospirillaceae bacterium]
MANYLVTGGCGFIGSHLADSLIADGHGVRIIDDLSTGKRANAPEGAEVIVNTIVDGAAVARALDGMDGCFHLAAVASVQKGVEDWAGTHRVNLEGTIHVFDGARGRDGGAVRPVVYASSAAVYGDNPAMPLTEESAARPISAYGADKLGCEQHGLVAAHVHGVPNTGLRFFNVYGPRQDPRSPYSGVISIFADRIGRGDGVTIFGDGGQTRDFVYVGDVVRCLRAAMAAHESAGAAKAAVYNVCTGRETTVTGLAETLGTLCGREVDIAHDDARTGDIRESLGDGAKASAELGFRAETTLADGLAETLRSLDEAA